MAEAAANLKKAIADNGADPPADAAADLALPAVDTVPFHRVPVRTSEDKGEKSEDFNFDCDDSVNGAFISLKPAFIGSVSVLMDVSHLEQVREVILRDYLVPYTYFENDDTLISGK